MKLADWLRKTGTKRIVLAGRLGISPSYVTALCQDANLPSLRLMQEIERETGGEVTARDFLAADPPFCESAR